MGLLLAGLSALVYGTADFLGGFASRKVPALLVAFVSQLVGLAALGAVVLAWAAGDPVASDWWWGALAGVGGGLGLAGFYRSLAAGPMAIVAPVTAVISALVPLLAGLAQGDRPSTLSWVGLAAAVPAIGLVSIASEEPGVRRIESSTLFTAVGAGVAFGLFFVAFGQARPEAELWPLVSARFASISILAGLVLATRAARPEGSWTSLQRSLPVVAATGVLDTSANGLYLLSTHIELLSLTSVLAALYPVSTVLLARLVLGERFLRVQLIGMGLAGLAVALIAAGR